MGTIAILSMLMIIVLLTYAHDDDKKRWAKERAELIDRIQSVDYVTFKTVQKPKEKVEKEKAKPPELV
jgi:hypothetical protein